MSGTPIENHLGELWSIFEFLNPGMLGTATVFKRLRQRLAGQDEGEDRVLLAKALKPFILRRTKARSSRTCPTRPSRPSTATWKPTSAGLRRASVHYRNALLKKDSTELNRSKIEVLEALLRLRQAACHPALIDAELASTSPQRQARHADPVSWPRSSRKGTRCWSSRSSPASCRSSATRLDQEKMTYEYLDGRTRNRAAQGRAVPERPRLPDLPDQPEGRRPRPEPDRRRVRLPARPLVEPGRRGPGHRPLAPDRPDPARLRLPADLPRHRRGEDPRPPAEEARPGRRHPQRRQPRDLHPHPRRPRIPAVVTKLCANPGIPWSGTESSTNPATHQPSRNIAC